MSSRMQEENMQQDSAQAEYDGIRKWAESETDRVGCAAPFKCNCSHERIEKAIISIGKKDIQEMIDDGKEVEVKCHFCNTAYTFSVEELKQILKQAKR